MCKKLFCNESPYIRGNRERRLIRELDRPRIADSESNALVGAGLELRYDGMNDLEPNKLRCAETSLPTTSNKPIANNPLIPMRINYPFDDIDRSRN